MEREQFAQGVREVLAHFHDRIYLGRHRLAAALDVAGQESSLSDQGQRLRRLVLEGIADLKPASVKPATAHAARQHRLLMLRHVEGISVDDAARELGISERQARRDHMVALSSLTSILWERYGRGQIDASLGDWTDGPSQTPLPALTDSVLEASLLKLGSLPPDGPAQLQEVVRSALVTVSQLADSLGVRFDISADTDVAPVAVNRGALRQIVVNLLSLCVESAAHGQVRVTMDDAMEDGPGAVVLRLSAPVAASRSTEREPLVLEDTRLLIAQRLAAMQGGTLNATVQSGAAALGGAQLAVALSLPAERLASILVIDDDPDAIRLYRRILSGTAYRLIEALTAAVALRTAADLRPDFVVLDVMMPSRDGWEILQRLKADPGTESIPIVVCSVLREQALAYSLGATAFITKPVSRQALLSTLVEARAEAVARRG